MTRLPNPAFWSGKRVLLTGHTGFKGSWAALWLARMGAEVHGLALPPDGEDHHFGLAGVESAVLHRTGDLRDLAEVETAVETARPDLVLHLAAQAILRRALRDPIETWATNVTGTVHLLSALRDFAPTATTLVVTSDKVYRNDDTGRAFVETDPLGGKDPYSASKAATEMVVASWRQTYPGAPLATVRGGNVIGGGDFGEARILPDIARAARAGTEVTLRNAGATRPWQHVLDCLSGYLLHLEDLSRGADLPALNIGPEPEPVTTVLEATQRVTARMGGQGWSHVPEAGSVEVQSLALDASAARKALGWGDRLNREESLDWTGDWYASWLAGAQMGPVTERQLASYTAAGP